jgi:glycine/D-amino acid oxidase-like deaminating enzyme
MKRDGATFSLWQENTPDYIPQNRFDPENVYDVLIVGAGITGITTALQLQKAGKKCIIAEAHNPGFGTTGGTTAHLNTLLDATYDQIESNFGKENAKLVAQATHAAIQLVADNVQTYNIDCGFSYKDAYLFSQEAKETKELEKIVEASQRAGVEVEYSDTIPIPDTFDKAARFARNARFHPIKYILALAAEFEKLGGVLRTNCLVQEFEKDNHFIVNTTSGQIKTQKIVYATHLPPGVNVYSFKCAPYRSYVMAFQLAEGHYPEALVYDMKDPYHYHRTQEVDGKQYLIVGGYDHKTGHEVHTQKQFLHLEAYIRGIYNVHSMDYQWSSQYFEPVDGLPYIGEMVGGKDIYVATGFSGNGMTLGTVSAIVLSDLLTKGESVYKKVFDASRIKPMASFTNFVKE